MAGFGGAGLLAELTTRGETELVAAAAVDDAPGAAVVRRLMRERGTGVSLSESTTIKEKEKKKKKKRKKKLFLIGVSENKKKVGSVGSHAERWLDKDPERPE
jgi:hypothetical protein